MARAATKRNRGAGKAARPVEPDQKKSRRKAEKTLEDELFFTRLRGHAKWAFALLAIVFAGSFVFLGVGSGNAGLGDVFSNVFGGGGAPSDRGAAGARRRAAEGQDRRSRISAQALERDGRSADAIAAYRAYLVANPKDEEILAALALVFQNQAAVAANDANAAARALSLAAPAAQFRPGAGALGQALGSFVDPLGAGCVDAGRDAVPGGCREVPDGQQGRARRLPAALGARARGLVGSDPLGVRRRKARVKRRPR